MEEKYFIQGTEIQGYTTDHNVNEEGILYKIGLVRPKYKNVLSLFVNLEDMKTRMQGGLRGSLRDFPIWQRAFFLLLIVILPQSLGSFFLYFNIVGIILLLLASVLSTLKVFYNLLKVNTTSYKGLLVNYAQQSDIEILSDEMMLAMNTLKERKMIKLAYTGNCLYLYQKIKEKPNSAISFFTSLLSKPQKLSEIQKAELTQNTLSYLQEPAFLSLLME